MQITPDVLLYPFRSEKWKEVFIIGGAIGFASIFMPLILLLFPAYGVRAMRQVMKGTPPSLPLWKDLNQLLKDTIWFMAVMIVYMLPSILVAGAAIFFFLLTFLITPAAMIGAGRQGGEAFGLIFVSGWVIYFLGLMVSSLLALPMQFLAFVGLSRAVAHDNLRQAFDVRLIWQMARTNLLNFGVSFVMVYGIYYLVTFLSVIAMYSLICSPIYYPLLAVGMMYASLVGGVLYGLAYRDAQSRFAMAGIIA